VSRRDTLGKMQRLIPCLAFPVVMVPALAAAAPERAPSPELRSLAGTVVSAESRWNRRGDRIYTHATIRAADGTTVEVRQPGGAVDDIGMIQFPSPPLLNTGDEVE